MKTTPKVLTCLHCGHKGEGVTKRLGYVGGQGYVQRNGCVDERECWMRWDKQNDLMGFNLEVR